jgi:hypothetical protein
MVPPRTPGESDGEAVGGGSKGAESPLLFCPISRLSTLFHNGLIALEQNGVRWIKQVHLWIILLKTVRVPDIRVCLGALAQFAR